MTFPKLPLIEGLGYRLADIEDALGPYWHAAFQRWFAGQTGAIASDGALLVYPDDYEAFLEGAPVYD